MLNHKIANNNLSALPPDFNFDTPKLLKALGNAKEALAELRGKASLFDKNVSNLLLVPLTTKEAVNSSNIENIHSTLDSVFQSEILSETDVNLPEKETNNYKKSLLSGAQKLKENNYTLTKEMIEDLQKAIVFTEGDLISGYRKKRKGGLLRIKNHSTGEIIYTPPDDDGVLDMLLNNFVEFFNNKEDSIDPLVKIAICHYQFEAIHPFEDGNGRVGRILLVLSFLAYKKLDIPVLYISDFLLKNRSEYYRLIQEVTSNKEWEDFIVFILKGIEVQSMATVEIFQKIRNFIDICSALCTKNKIKIKTDFFILRPYYTISYTAEQSGIDRNTAARYLKKLKEQGFLVETKIRKEKVFFSSEFLNILSGN